MHKFKYLTIYSANCDGFSPAQFMLLTPQLNQSPVQKPLIRCRGGRDYGHKVARIYHGARFFVNLVLGGINHVLPEKKEEEKKTSQCNFGIIQRYIQKCAAQKKNMMAEKLTPLSFAYGFNYDW